VTQGQGLSLLKTGARHGPLWLPPPPYVCQAWGQGLGIYILKGIQVFLKKNGLGTTGLGGGKEAAWVCLPMIRSLSKSELLLTKELLGAMPPSTAPQRVGQIQLPAYWPFAKPHLLHACFTWTLLVGQGKESQGPGDRCFFSLSNTSGSYIPG
jgi:hypothetical protein